MCVAYMMPNWSPTLRRQPETPGLAASLSCTTISCCSAIAKGSTGRAPIPSAVTRRSACRVACVYLSTSLILALLAPCVCACSQVVPRSQRVFPSHLQTCALHAETAGQHWVQSLPVRLYARADSLSSHPRHPPSVSNYQMMALADQFQSGTLPRAANQSVLLAPIGLTSGFLGRLAVAAEIFQM